MATTVVPAFGRDYPTASAARADWAAGKDFIIMDIFDPGDGRYINRDDADDAGVQVRIRHDRLRQITYVRD